MTALPSMSLRILFRKIKLLVKSDKIHQHLDVKIPKLLVYQRVGEQAFGSKSIFTESII